MFRFRFEPATSQIPSSVFFPTNPDERLSQCSASLQALLALSPTTLHALSKLVTNADIIADEIIGVMRNVMSQYPPKGNPDIDTSIEVPLSVRLWRVSGCHELLASLGFDLMEVGQDQVTLRTGKQANRRTCQFVLQALLALFDTNEAPKSIGIDSSSSCESLNDESRQDNRSNTMSPIPGTTTSSQQRSISPVGTVKSMSLKLPNLPSHRPLLGSGSAFTSYVRKRGEPDGGRETTIPAPSMLTNIELNTDSDISDGYSTRGIGNRFDAKPTKINYTNLRAPKVVVCARGGGGESDAAFTPSPPITLQNVDNNVSMALAHQTKIRNLYSVSNSMNVQSNESHVPSSQRPDDSSSSASSTNDWDGSGHATVLRRAQQQQQNQPNGLPPMPPPRQMLPLVESLRPQVPSYNNLNGKTKGSNNAIESTSSDSEFESKAQKSSQSQSSLLTRNISEECLLMDRLSVRTENTNNIVPMPAIRKQLKMSDTHDTSTLPFKFNANNLYFSSSADSDVIESQHKDISLTLKANSAKENNKPNLSSSHNKNIQDLILRKINREMTPTISDVYHERNMDLGLAPPLSKLLLSKNYEENDTKSNTIKKVNSTETVSDINLNTSLALYVSGETTDNELCDICKKHPSMSVDGMMCQCSKNATQTQKSISKPWLNNLNGNSTIANTASSNEFCNVDTIDRNQTKANNFSGSDNETANIMENENGSVATMTSNTTNKRLSTSPVYSDLSKRDEGDGRSVTADSQYSNNYKTIDLNANSKLSQVQQRINKFNMASANNK